MTNSQTSSARLKLSQSLKKAWAEGRKTTSEKQRKFFSNLATPEILRFANERSCAMTRGGHGFGKNRRGNVVHPRAKLWTIESPTGKQFVVSNLFSWLQQNEHMLPKDETTYKIPVWKRAMTGFTLQLLGRSRQWRGWRVITSEELNPANIKVYEHDFQI